MEQQQVNLEHYQTKATEIVYGQAFREERFWVCIEQDGYEVDTLMTYSIMDDSPKFAPKREVLKVKVYADTGVERGGAILFPLFDPSYGLNAESLKAFLLCVEDAKERAKNY